VYRNLIQNAIEATPAGGLVLVATEAAGSLVQVRIYDTGKGIARERLSTIFETSSRPSTAAWAWGSRSRARSSSSSAARSRSRARRQGHHVRARVPVD